MRRLALGRPRVHCLAPHPAADGGRQRGDVLETSPELQRATERAIAIAGSLTDARAWALPRAMMGAGAAFTGRLREGAREMQAALNDMDQNTDPHSNAMIADFLAITYARLGEFDAAEEIVARGTQQAARTDEISRVDIDITQSAVNYERGDELATVTNMAPFRTLTKGLLASSYAQLGDLPTGVAGWNEALSAARGMNDRYGEARVLWTRGRTFALQSPPDWTAALADFEKVVGLFGEMEARPALARALHDRAKTLRALGRLAEAGEVEQRALTLGRELGLKDAPFA